MSQFRSYDCHTHGTVQLPRAVSAPDVSRTDCRYACDINPRCYRYLSTADEALLGSCFLYGDSTGETTIDHRLKPNKNEEWCERRQPVSAWGGGSYSWFKPLSADDYDTSPASEEVRSKWALWVLVGSVIVLLIVGVIVWVQSSKGSTSGGLWTSRVQIKMSKTL